MLTFGIKYSQMHDSFACIVRDGEFLFAVAQEHISRIIHDARFPSWPFKPASILPRSSLRPLTRSAWDSSRSGSCIGMTSAYLLRTASLLFTRFKRWKSRVLLPCPVPGIRPFVRNAYTCCLPAPGRLLKFTMTLPAHFCKLLPV